MNINHIIEVMKHSPLENYAGVPGLTSWLIGSPGPRGTVRLLECSRNHQEPVTPHSHRFDFVCQVLAGRVRNLIWEDEPVPRGDMYLATNLVYQGEPGKYERGESWRSAFSVKEDVYSAGASYSMKANQIHSIFFGRGTKVLFFEGPQVSEQSIILEPMVDGVAIPTFDIKDWMFKQGAE